MLHAACKGVQHVPNSHHPSLALTQFLLEKPTQQACPGLGVKGIQVTTQPARGHCGVTAFCDLHISSHGY